MPSPRATLLTCAVALAAVAAAGCSGPRPADLFLVQRTGSIPGARLTLRLSDDGGAYCNGGPRKELTSAQLIRRARSAASSTAARTATSASPRSTSS